MKDRFLRACRREPVDARRSGSCARPAATWPSTARFASAHAARNLQAARAGDEVTLQPVRRIGVDAAILFADILLPLEPMGAPFEFVRGRRAASIETRARPS